MNKHYDPDVPGTLIVETMKLIDDSGKSVPDLFLETGIPFYWLKRFVDKGFVNPSVNRVQFLYEHLSGTKLKLS